MRPSDSSEAQRAGAVAQQSEVSSIPLSFSAASPLSFEALELLYAAADWGVLLRDPRAARAYGVATGRLSPLAMFRALALPYLIHIESEEALARELQERGRLRRLCGFEERAPSRAMFWHFRHAPPGFHPEVMLRVLVALGLAGQSLRLALPCVRLMGSYLPQPVGPHVTFQFSPYGPEIDMWTTPAEGSLPALQTAGNLVEDLYRDMKIARAPRRRRGLSGQLDLPAEFAVPFGDHGRAWFVIDLPDWLKAGSGARTRSKDTLTTLGGARVSPYAAINVIVVRQHEGAQQVLLSRRLNGTWKGEYILPGGKAKLEESLEGCTRRELEEETGLTLARSRPISVHLVRLPGRPLVFSVGAVVTEFEGTPRRKERVQNEDWQWFSVHDLPPELALPAKLALGEYLKGRRQDLDWSDVEFQWQRSTRAPEQLRFGGPFALPGDGTS